MADMLWLGGFLAVLLLFLLKRESDKECDQLSVEEIEICSKKLTQRQKLVFLSDLHDKSFGKDNCRLVEAIAGIKPDAILIGGDMMNVRTGKISLDVTQKLLRDLTAIAPVCYANGNNEQRLTWEYKQFGAYRSRFRQLLDSCGVCYLDNKSVDLGSVRVTGLDLELDHYHEFAHKALTTAFMDEAVGKAEPDKFNLLLCHSPMFLDTYARWGADLVLTGHSHGGVIRFPTDRNRVPGKMNNDRGLVSGQYQLFHKYCAGVFRKETCCMVVSRGLGTHTVNVRINNLPQLVVVDLHNGEK
ncbi:MAG: metallophosphoesterase [Oscillospiraceae bacterium]|nr:metallophosphoesterase [Oscillospiraceae bacterium]